MGKVLGSGSFGQVVAATRKSDNKPVRSSYFVEAKDCNQRVARRVTEWAVGLPTVTVLCSWTSNFTLTINASLHPGNLNKIPGVAGREAGYL